MPDLANAAVTQSRRKRGWVERKSRRLSYDILRYGSRVYALSFHERLLRIMLLVALSVFSVLSFNGQAEAHAVLEQTSPEANARMDVSPQAVEISFNERLDSGGSKLLVLNESSRDVAKGKVESINEGKGIRIALPKLSEGHYTVSYSVISADGHPISGAYVFTVGNPDPLPDASQLDPHQQIGHSHNHGSAGLDQQSFLLYSARILYYAGLLSVAGLALWGLLRKPSSVVREVYARSLGLAGKFALLATIAYVFSASGIWGKASRSPNGDGS